VKRNMVAMATLDEETAAGCFYSLARKSGEGGSSKIQGPSIRMAEIALSCYGNIRAGCRSLGETDDGRFVRELGVCHDVENNVVVAREITRRITKKNGQRYGDDMIGVTRAAAAAIALRNAIFTVVPRALVKPAYDQAKDVAVGKTKSLETRRGEILSRLKKLSATITLDRVLAVVEKRSIEEVQWDDIEHLIGLGTAIKDGMQTVEQAFPAPVAAPTSVADVLGKPATNGNGGPKPEAPAPAEAKSAEKAEPTIESAEPLGACITTDGVNILRRLCADQNVSFDALESAFDGPIGKYSEPDKTAAQVYAMAEKWILDTAGANKAEADAAAKKEQPAAGNGELFGGAESGGKPPRGVKGGG